MFMECQPQRNACKALVCSTFLPPMDADTLAVQQQKATCHLRGVRFDMIVVGATLAAAVVGRAVLQGDIVDSFMNIVLVIFVVFCFQHERYWGTLVKISHILCLSAATWFLVSVVRNDCAFAACYSIEAEQHPTYVCIAYMVHGFVVAITRQMSFATNLKLVVIDYVLLALTYGILWFSRTSSATLGMAVAHAVQQWYQDLLTMLLLTFMLEFEERFACLELVAKQKQAEEDKMLAALVGHEIKNPLTVLVHFFHVINAPENTFQKWFCQAISSNDGADTTALEALGCTRESDDSKAVEHMLQGALRCTSVLVDIVENCRYLTKVESGTYEAQADLLDLTALVGKVIEACRGVYAREIEAGLEFELECDDDLQVVSDRRMWMHVLMNLVGNAVKFTMHEHSQVSSAMAAAPATVSMRALAPAPTPRVAVRVLRTGGSALRVEVVDNGPGIASNDKTARGLGSGLGLHLSEKIIQMLGGSLELASPLRDNRGAMFVWSVHDALQGPPLHKEISSGIPGVGKCDAMRTALQHNDQFPAAALLPSKKAEVLQSVDQDTGIGFGAMLPETLSVLVVEDDDLSFRVLCASLEQGFQKSSKSKLKIAHVYTVEEALSQATASLDGEDGATILANACAYDIIISDLHLGTVGGMLKGTDLFRKLCALDFRHGEPVLVMASGQTEEADVDAYRACGAAIVWPKPYPHPATMARDIITHLNRKRLQPREARFVSKEPHVQHNNHKHIEVGGSWQNGYLPTVPVHDYFVTSRAIASEQLSRVYIIRLIMVGYFCAQLVVVLVHDMTQRRHSPSWTTMDNLRQFSFYQMLGTLVICMLEWHPGKISSRWRIGVRMQSAGLVTVSLARLVWVTVGLCDSPRISSFPHGPFRVCDLYRKGLVDMQSTSVFFLLNAWVCFLGAISFQEQMCWVAAEFVLLVAGSVAIIARAPKPEDPQLVGHTGTVNVLWAIVQLFWLLVSIERRRRYHFLGMREKEKIVRQQRQFVQLLCREIKNPLNFISFSLDRLGGAFVSKTQIADIPNPASTKNNAKTSQDEGRAVSGRDLQHMYTDAIKCRSMLVDIVENCRQLAKVESGSYATLHEVVHLRELAESCRALHSREIEAGLEFELECDDDLQVVSDRRMWMHVLMNLVGNAVKFTMHEHSQVSSAMAAAPATVSMRALAPAPTPRVAVRVLRTGGSALRVEVVDNGPGIASDDQAFIFGKFAQGRVRRGVHGLGSGLGLHLSEKIIQMLGSSLELVSPLRGGRGTMCIFEISCTFRPLQAVISPGKNKVLPAHAPAGANAQALRVLVVEDDDLSALVMKQSIVAGMEQVYRVAATVTLVRTAEQALDLISKSPAGQNAFDAIITDQHMELAGGTLLGTDMLAKLSSLDYSGPGARPLYVVASANSEKEDLAFYLARGADLVWPKPYPRADQLARDLEPLVSCKPFTFLRTCPIMSCPEREGEAL